MVVAPLLSEIGILHATPSLYRLPDDAKLGPFRKKYGNLFGMLEESPGKPNTDGKYFADADGIDQSVEMFQRLYKDQDAHVQLDEFIRARLFDIWVGDWSKHEDNWKWAMFKTEEGPLYRPIPRDRDHVFSRQDGLINWLADRKFGMQNIEDFGHDFEDIRSLTYQARNMDRFLMQEATRQMFIEQAKYIQANISEKEIEEAVKKMPPEVMSLSGNEIEAKLKNRIKHLHEAADTYYSLLNKEVDVTGSKDEEYFEITHQTDGSVRVQVFNVSDNKKGEKLLYDRTFLPAETREVRLWGLADEDIFHVTGNGKGNKITVRAFGGPGDDVFESEAAAKTLFYDKGLGTNYKTGKHAKVAKTWNSAIYEYDRVRFDYDYFLPLISLGYSRYTGFGVNLSGNWTHRKFTKDIYHSKHKLYAGYTTQGNISAGYNGRFHQAVRRWDFLVDAYVAQPHLQNRFYGVGNSSINLSDETGRNFYQSAVNTVQASVGFVRDFWQKSSFEMRTGIEQHRTDLIENTFMRKNASLILGTTGDWLMMPYRLQLDLDFRDRKGLPYKGARALLAFESNHVLNGPPLQYWFQIVKGDIEYYMSTKQKHPLTLGLRIGGATSTGDVPWFKLPTIGFNNGLRGYVEDRFAGTSTAYFNTELRYQIVQAYTSIIPVKVGVKTFYDYGRVFSNEENESKDWHSGYGFGLYVVPLNEALTLSLTFGFSEEETLYPLFSLGTPLR